MRNKLTASPVKNKLPPHNFTYSEGEPLVISPIDGGMVTTVLPKNLQPNEAVDLKNFVVRYGRTSRRTGTSDYPAAKPNTNKILGLFAYDKSDGSAKIIRFTKNTVHAGSAGNWQVVTGPALTGTDEDRFSVAILEDRLFFSNEGADVIHELSTGSNTYAVLGNAPEYKYLVGFGDRLVGLNYNGLVPNFSEVGWSGNRNYAEWNPSVDATAGSTVLTSSGSDLSDPITGGTAFSNTMQIFRERSIWEASLTNSYSNPFYFYQKIPGIGCDCPYSIAKRPGGVCFVDFRTKAVYVYSIDGQIVPISDQVTNSFISNITDKNNVIGAYNNTEDEYSILLVDNLSSEAEVWTYSFRTKRWWYSVWYGLSYITNLDYITGTVTINDLVGTIDQLIGTIDELSPSTQADTFFLGTTSGDVWYTDPTKSTDSDAAHTTYESVRTSPEFELPVEANYVNEVLLEYVVERGLAGSFVLSYSKDGGAFTNVKTITWLAADNGKNMICRFKKNIRSRRFQWRITVTSGLIALSKFRVNIDRGGDTKSR